MIRGDDLPPHGLSVLFIPYLLRIKDLQIAEFPCQETLNNEYDDLFAEDIN